MKVRFIGDEKAYDYGFVYGDIYEVEVWDDTIGGYGIVDTFGDRVAVHPNDVEIVEGDPSELEHVRGLRVNE